MTPAEYTKAVLRTAAMDQPEKIKVAVFALGLCGEAAEFADDPSIAEAGDVLWYAAAMAHAAGLELQHVLEGETFAGFQKLWVGSFFEPLEIAVCAGRLADHVKKFVGHGKPLSTVTVELHLHNVLICLAQALKARDLELDNAATSNVAKLLTRYPDGFDLAVAAALPTNLHG